MSISGSAIATLVVFILSITFVIFPVSVPLRPFYPKVRFPINHTTAPIVAIAALAAAQCLGRTEFRNGIIGTEDIKPYNILILFFSLAYMTITLDITGVLQAAAFWVSNKGGSNGYKLYFYFYLMLTLLSIVLGNDPVILSGTVFLVYYTNVVEVDPLAWLIAEFAAANTASMVLFVGNPTNVVLCEGFRINNVKFSHIPFSLSWLAVSFALSPSLFSSAIRDTSRRSSITRVHSIHSPSFLIQSVPGLAVSGWGAVSLSFSSSASLESMFGSSACRSPSGNSSLISLGITSDIPAE
jgi:Na+/H+ antiporter NhaD/arsenite permease-like protein